MFSTALQDNETTSLNSVQALGEKIKSLQRSYQQLLLQDRKFEELKTIKEQIRFYEQKYNEHKPFELKGADISDFSSGHNRNG